MFMPSELAEKLASNEKSSCESKNNETGLSLVLSFLYLGSEQDALAVETLRKNQITHVINASVDGPITPYLQENDREHFMRVPVHDSLSASLRPHFDKVYEFIERARASNGRVLIHCFAGISRSPALAIAYVMRHLSICFDDAYAMIKLCRPQISPNFHFVGELVQYEETLSLTQKQKPDNTGTASYITIKIPFQSFSNFRSLQVCRSKNQGSQSQEKSALRRPSTLGYTSNSPCTSRRMLPLVNCLSNMKIGGSPPSSRPVRPNKIALKCFSAVNRSTNDFVSSRVRERFIPKSAAPTLSKEPSDKSKLLVDDTIFSNSSGTMDCRHDSTKTIVNNLMGTLLF